MQEWSLVMGRGRVGSGRSVLLLLLCGTLLLTGCGLLRRSSDTPDPAATPTEDSEPTVEPSADSNEAPEEEAQAPDESGEIAPPEQTEAGEQTTEAGSTPAGEADAEEVEAADPPASAPDEAVPSEDAETVEVPETEGFLVDLPPEERAALQEQIQTDLTTALEILDAWAGVPEVSTETAEQLQTVQDFVELTRAAVDEEDLLGASNLALKARILALEIGRP